MRTCSGSPLGRHSRPPVLEVPDQLLLLGVYRDDRIARRHGRLGQRVDAGELGVAIGVAGTLSRLAIALQAVLQTVQQARHRLMADPMPLLAQFVRQPPQALACPA